MNTLFPIQPTFPEGFSYYLDFLTTQEEEELFQAISSVELHDFNFQGFIAREKWQALDTITVSTKEHFQKEKKFQ